MKKKKLFGANVGSASILLIFIVLCLISLSILSLSSSLSDYRLSKKVSERQTSYYEACNKAEREFAILDSNLSNDSASISEVEFYEKYGYSYSLVYPVSDIQSLYITIHPSYQKLQNSHFYSVSRWQTIVNNDIIYDESLHVMQ